MNLKMASSPGKAGSHASPAEADNEPPNDYEEMVQKLEADVRQHIRVEQQLKLHIENIQEKSDEDAKVIDKLDREKQRHKRELK